jgi:hypothetical protein
MSVATILGNGRAPARNRPLSLGYDGAPAISPLGGSPWGVMMRRGEVYFTSEQQGYLGRLRRGRIEHLVTELASPMIFAIDQDDTVYIPEYDADQITIVDRQGNRSLGLARVVKNPMSVRYVNGRYYVADTGNHRILEWDPTTDDYDVVAGTGTAGYRSGIHDSLESPLFFPIDLDLNEQGEIVIADGMNNRLRLVDTDGLMRTIAGSGPQCLEAKDSVDPCSNDFLGDGPALEISINWPFSPRFDRTGNIWFLDANNNLLRCLTTEGEVRTIAGQRSLPWPVGQNEWYAAHYPDSYGKEVGDGDPAGPSAMALFHPMGIDLQELADGKLDILIADTDNQRIRYLHDVSL